MRRIQLCCTRTSIVNIRLKEDLLFFSEPVHYDWTFLQVFLQSCSQDFRFTFVTKTKCWTRCRGISTETRRVVPERILVRGDTRHQATAKAYFLKSDWTPFLFSSRSRFSLGLVPTNCLHGHLRHVTLRSQASCVTGATGKAHSCSMASEALVRDYLVFFAQQGLIKINKYYTVVVQYGNKYNNNTIQL